MREKLTGRQSRRSVAQVETIILLGSDGRHVILGRYAGPDAAEIEKLAIALRAKGLGGWVARMSGDYWHRCRSVRLQAMQEAPPGPVTFAKAVAAFDAIRSGALAP